MDSKSGQNELTIQRLQSLTLICLHVAAVNVNGIIFQDWYMQLQILLSLKVCSQHTKERPLAETLWDNQLALLTTQYTYNFISLLKILSKIQK